VCRKRALLEKLGPRISPVFFPRCKNPKKGVNITRDTIGARHQFWGPRVGAQTFPPFRLPRATPGLDPQEIFLMEKLPKVKRPGPKCLTLSLYLHHHFLHLRKIMGRLGLNPGLRFQIRIQSHFFPNSASHKCVQQRWPVSFQLSKTNSEVYQHYYLCPVWTGWTHTHTDNSITIFSTRWRCK